MRHSLAFNLLFAAASAGAADVVTPPADYQVSTRAGFTLLVHRDVTDQPADRFQRKPLDVLDTELSDLKRVLGPKLLPVLQQVPIWVNWNARNSAAPGVIAVYYGATGKLAPQETLRANTIEILSLKRIGELRTPGSKFQQIITLHEMAHAIHHRVLGLDAPDVKAAFQQAVERRLYEQALDRFGRRAQPYARTNPNEYFAELSCAFLDSCHYYPFTFSDLAAHDPAGFALMDAVWKKPEQFAGRAPAVPTPKFAVAGPATTTGLQAEQAAFALVDRARARHRAGQRDDARKSAEQVVRYYPGTLASADARKLLEQLR